MNGILSLSPGQGAPQIGDLITLEIIFEEKTSGEWKFDPDTPWLASGSFTLSAKSLKTVPTDGNLTKLTVEALVHESGPLRSGELNLKRGEAAYKVPAADLSLTVNAPAQAAGQEAAPPPWTLPPIPFGGWNIILIALLGALLLAAIAFGVKRLLTKVKSGKNLDHRKRALQALQNLQKFARHKKAPEQEEWKKFSFELAGILRKYADENFLIDSSDMTDREFLAELRLQPKAQAQVDRLAAVLSTINEVRYGKKALEVTTVPGLLLESKQFVDQTFISKEAEK